MTEQIFPMKEKLLRQMQNFVATSCVGASAMRNQGGSGLLKEARTFFKALNLSAIPKRKRPFDSWLDRQTKKLRLKFPKRSQKFAVARKALNLFLRSAAYNTTLNKGYALTQLLPLLEVPLDSYVHSHLKAHYQHLPSRWARLKHLSEDTHATYQDAAQKLAREWHVDRVDLDVFFYREEVPVA
jgi:hypothetical protein